MIRNRRLQILSLLAVVSSGAALVANAGPTRGLVAHYPLNTDATDASGHGNDGVPVGGPVVTAGFRGSAVLLDGADDLIELPRSIEGDFSVSFWVRTTVIAPAATLWYEGLGMVDAEVCGSPPDGDWGIALVNGGRVMWNDLESATEINDGLWHPVVLTLDINAGRVRVWIDGNLEIDATGQPTSPLTAPPWIGLGNNPCDSSLGVQFFAGSIDEVRFYDRVLAELEVDALSQDWVFFDDLETDDLTGWSASVP